MTRDRAPSARADTAAAQGVKRSAVRRGATLARRKFRPRPGWDGCGGNPRAGVRYADNALHAAYARQTGKGSLLGQRSPSSLKATQASMACGCPPGPDRAEARLNSRFANVKSFKQGRRLTPRPTHPSACLTGPMGTLVRWFLMVSDDVHSCALSPKVVLPISY